MLNDKDASSRRALKTLLDECSEPIPQAGPKISHVGNNSVVASNSTVIVVSPSGLRELTGAVRELGKQLVELRDALLARQKE